MQLFGMILSKGKLLQVCPSCYKIVHDKETAKLEITKQQLAVTGFLEKGYKQSDLKEHLKRWAKNQKEQV